MLLKSRASPYMLPFSPCNKKRLAIQYRNRLLSPTLSIPSYDIGKYVALRTYQHPIVSMCMCVCVCIYIIYIYRCPRRNGQNFGRVFLMLNYTDITQNTYIQS